MNKILAALAIAFFATTASAVISGSRHDFVSNGYVTPAPATACIFCHVPHGAQSAATTGGAPLWAPGRAITDPTSFYKTNASVDTKGTKTCLGCHATGLAADMGTTGSIPAGPKVVGTDLSNDHPVGNATVITTGGVMQATINLGGLTVVSGTTTVECSTCHDVHNANTQAGTKLLRAFSGSDFCLACHNK